jgi:hypothetical protein
MGKPASFALFNSAMIDTKKRFGRDRGNEPQQCSSARAGLLRAQAQQTTRKLQVCLCRWMAAGEDDEEARKYTGCRQGPL